MRREGRPHGMVRTYRILPDPFNPRPDPRAFKSMDSPATAGAFTRVPSKPTNHSKPTGKCGMPRCTDCHVNPPFKSKDKAKGAQKLKSRDVVTNHRFLAWRAGDNRRGADVGGYSATEVLGEVVGDRYDYDQDYDSDSDGPAHYR
ncbi:hypothetical protein Tsubulata_003828 [Turnera subulata]|uniref:Uncharacterized protein n=1 Tax=Turnera subulata TaxID=218843 RepID=A0A9Q0GAP0_9ROSI|nr:hypothetical protein Tsubulata_003828 [Turnera subulata]